MKRAARLSPRAAAYLPRAIRYLGHYRREAAWAYAALIIATLSQLMVPQLIQRILDTVTHGYLAHQVLTLPSALQALAAERLGASLEELASDAALAPSALWWTGALVIVFALIRGLFAFAQAYMGERASQSVSFDMRNELFAKIQRLSFSYHDRNQTGQLMVRATDDVEKVRMFIGQGLLMAVGALVMMTGTLIILSLTNLRLMLVILPILPAGMILFMVFGAVARPLFEFVQAKLSRLNAILQENMAGIKVVKAFSREPQQEKRFDAAATDYMGQMLRVTRLMTFLMPTIFLIANLGQALVVYYGGRQILAGTLTLGEWQKFGLYLVFVFLPIGQLGFIITQMSQAAASARRIFEILDAHNDVADRPGARPLPEVRGRVEFENVTFRYFGGDKPVLQQVSFTAEPGQTIALLGMTGSGKSTIINLIPRFYDPSEGRILVDGMDLQDVTLDSWRRQIGIVLQETTLFSGTVRDNIAFGRPDAPMEDVVAAARAAAADEFIREFPQGYDTPVGERGTTLSGGQRQRIALARALLLNPRILIMDDSTSSVDFQTELHIHEALDALMRDRTSFVIAQRISTVRNADLILVLDQGRVAARGTHDELMETSELYADIYSSQLVDVPTVTPPAEVSALAQEA
jgi:ATP-binding cassette, subfamily B, multidrug efflux pump